MIPSFLIESSSQTSNYLSSMMKSFHLTNEPAPLSLSPKSILPQDKRPNLSEVITSPTSIPLIDLSNCDHSNPSSSLVVQKIAQACEEFGFFQILNHGVPEQVCNNMLAAIAEFFELPREKKEHLTTTDHTKSVKLYNYYLNVDGGQRVTMWSECFGHPWYPVEDIINLLPENIDTKYGEAFSEYAREIGPLVRRILRLMSRGLGIEQDGLLKILDKDPRLRAQANFYPPCPEPELTLGLPIHTDFNAITVLLQSTVPGLQVIKDGKWISVPVIPSALIVNIGDQIEVMSNGRFKSVHHRVVTNEVHERMSMSMFYGPNIDTIIGPVEDLVDEEHPTRYRKYRYSEFIQEFSKQEGTRQMVKETFEIPHDSK